MRKNFFLLLTLFSLISSWAVAQKSIYIPQEWRNRTDTLIWAESDPNNQYTWSRSRSIENDNVIVLWDKYYGSTAPNELSTSDAYYVDIEDLLAKCEAFYQLESSQLGFVDPETSNVSKYKIMVLMNHTTTWTCYGGGYDYMVPALWLNPSTCKPVGSAVAHEVGHSFHYMCYSEASEHGTKSGVEAGFHTALGKGQCIWETTANWQALQSYPEEIFTLSGTGSYFARTHNYAFSHEWHRYQAYMFLMYLTEYYNDVKTVANVWNQTMTAVSDFNQALMANKNLSVEELYKLHFNFALHCPTYDMEACKSYRDSYIGNFNYHAVLIGDSTYQVALASCPQSTGFNVIPLKVPAAGTEVTTDFTALRANTLLADGDPAEYINGNGVLTTSSQIRYNNVSKASQRAFRLGYVFLMNDGTTQYAAQDSLYCTGAGVKTAHVSVTVPENVKQMWLVVSPTPKVYFQHQWDESISGDDMWPYQVHFNGTDLTSHATVYAEPTLDDRALGDVTLTYDVTFPLTSGTDHSGTSVAINGIAEKQLGTALQLTLDDLNSKLVSYSSTGPSAGQVMFYAAKDGALVKSASTANGYGHWFSITGSVCAYASGYIYSEYYPTTATFYIGQYPGKCSSSRTYTISQAFRYKRTTDSGDTEDAKAVFVFRVKPGSAASVNLVSIDYDEEKATAIQNIAVDDTNGSLTQNDNAIYDLSGRRLRVKPAHGLYIQNGKKFYVK